MHNFNGKLTFWTICLKFVMAFCVRSQHKLNCCSFTAIVYTSNGRSTLIGSLCYNFSAFFLNLSFSKPSKFNWNGHEVGVFDSLLSFICFWGYLFYLAAARLARYSRGDCCCQFFNPPPRSYSMMSKISPAAAYLKKELKCTSSIYHVNVSGVPPYCSLHILVGSAKLWWKSGAENWGTVNDAQERNFNVLQVLTVKIKCFLKYVAKTSVWHKKGIKSTLSINSDGF